MSITIPILKYGKFDAESLKQTFDIGFAYCELPPSIRDNVLLNITTEKALTFFKQDESIKESMAPWNESTLSGYMSRQKPFNQQLAVIYMRKDQILPPFIDSPVSQLAQIFYDEIALPLLQSTFEFFNISRNLSDLLKEPFITFTFNYYAGNISYDKNDNNFLCGMTDHKDFGIIGILHVTKPGLSVLLKDKTRVAIDPLPGHVIINWGNALSMVTDNQCNAAIHGIPKPLPYERLSFGLFIDPNINEPLKNYITNETIFERYGDYIDAQFKKTYTVDNSIII